MQNDTMMTHPMHLHSVGKGLSSVTTGFRLRYEFS
ncbi:hypothetical protein CXF95_09970 [Paraglaciecola sp. MB-3u-78]|nr:hypothetical protein CXF95_09970 [Paraglaciecola sp. MB-3u-78]